MKSNNVIDFYGTVNNMKYCEEKIGNCRDSVASKVFDRMMIALALYSENPQDFNLGNVITLIFSLAIYPSYNILPNGNDCEKSVYNFLYNRSSINEFIHKVMNTDMLLSHSKIESDAVSKFYKETSNLKKITRSGHVYWNVLTDRKENIAEHVYGTIALAEAINANYNLDLDFKKVLTMLALHETEEIIMGDTTEFDTRKEDKTLIGKKCARKVLKGLKRGKEYSDLLDEFNAKETKESVFAYLCDKMEYLLQVKVYEELGLYDFENRPDNVVTNSDRVREIIGDGASSVFEVHAMYDESKFEKDLIFKELFDTICSKNILNVQNENEYKKLLK